MVKVGQALHMGGQYVPLDEPDVLYFTQIHQYGHMVWLWGYVPSNPLRGAVRALWATCTTPPIVTILMDLSEIKHIRLTQGNILTPHMQGLTHFDHGVGIWLGSNSVLN